MSTERFYPEGLLGKKVGMTQVFDENGSAIPVTVIQAGPCHVTQVKTREKEGYEAVQVGFEPKKVQRTNKPAMGHLRKASKGSFYHLQEIRCSVEELGWGAVGTELGAGDVFQEGDRVDVRGVSKGRGFQGVVRKFGMRGQPATRGTHEVRRHVGSIGCRKFPGRVWKNKRMPGQMGNKDVAVINLRIVQVLPEQNLILVRGAVPGPKDGVLVIRRSRRKYDSPRKLEKAAPQEAESAPQEAVSEG